jgi:predicted DNA-binding transcriptional regulator YafY
MDQEKAKDEICRAIAERKVVQFRYGDKVRVVEPYVCGVSSANKYILRGFQTGGQSSSGRKLGWRLFELANMKDLEITETEFNGYGGDRRLYNPKDPAMRKIFCSVKR